MSHSEVAKVSGAAVERRSLRFSSVSEALEEAERCVRAERAGTLQRAGNWTLGQILGHLAAWINYAYEGYPFTAPPDAVARARAHKDRALENGLTVGYRIAGVEGGTTGVEEIPADVGLGRFRRAWSRLERKGPDKEHAFFGALTYEEWVKLNLRHSELHLGFVDPGAA